MRSVNETLREGQVDFIEIGAPMDGEVLRYVLEKHGLGAAVGPYHRQDLTKSSAVG